MCRGYEGCYLIDSADVIGVRETRRFEANYQLNEQDIAQARTFEDWVVTKSNFFFDLHNVEAPDWMPMVNTRHSSSRSRIRSRCAALYQRRWKVFC